VGGNVGPLPATGPKNLPPLSLSAVRARLHTLESQIKYQQKDRFAAPMGLHELNNASALQYAQGGAAPSWDQASGGYMPSPVLATLLFNMPGALTLSTSDPLHSRWPCNITGLAADLNVFGSDVTFKLLVNGSTVATETMTGAAIGLIPVSGSPALRAYLDLVQVETTVIGTGNIGLVVHVELAVDVANLAVS
jgi:hypothetical protein